MASIATRGLRHIGKGFYTTPDKKYAIIRNTGRSGWTLYNNIDGVRLYEYPNLFEAINYLKCNIYKYNDKWEFRG